MAQGVGGSGGRGLTTCEPMYCGRVARRTGSRSDAPTNRPAGTWRRRFGRPAPSSDRSSALPRASPPGTLQRCRYVRHRERARPASRASHRFGIDRFGRPSVLAGQPVVGEVQVDASRLDRAVSGLDAVTPAQSARQAADRLRSAAVHAPLRPLRLDGPHYEPISIGDSATGCDRHWMG